MTSAGDSAPSTSVSWIGDISPSQITANQNNYDPTGLSAASVLRLSTDASRDITGLAGGADGRLIIIHNVGSFNIVLKDESASSSAGNRFALSADVTLAPDNVAALQYDSTSSRWRAVSSPTDVSAATSHIAASAAVHGLPASVNVLGNRSAAGEFAQRGTIASITVGSSALSAYEATSAVTFSVAFSSTPIVLSGGTTSNANQWSGAYNVSTTGFTYQRWSSTSGGAAVNLGWVAFGA